MKLRNFAIVIEMLNTLCNQRMRAVIVTTVKTELQGLPVLNKQNVGVDGWEREASP